MTISPYLWNREAPCVDKTGQILIIDQIVILQNCAETKRIERVFNKTRSMEKHSIAARECTDQGAVGVAVGAARFS